MRNLAKKNTLKKSKPKIKCKRIEIKLKETSKVTKIRKKKVCYDAESLIKAVNDYKSGKLSLREAEELYGVPRTV